MKAEKSEEIYNALQAAIPMSTQCKMRWKNLKTPWIHPYLTHQPFL